MMAVLKLNLSAYLCITEKWFGWTILTNIYQLASRIKTCGDIMASNFNTIYHIVFPYSRFIIFIPVKKHFNCYAHKTWFPINTFVVPMLSRLLLRLKIKEIRR